MSKMSHSEDSPPAGGPGRPGSRVGPRRASARDSAFLAVCSAVNGLLAYVFFMLASRSLGSEAAAPVSVLWSYWALAGAVLTFPVQHWIIRRFTSDGHEGTVARSLPRLSAIAVVIAVGTGLAAYALRDPLFHDPGVGFPVMVAAITIGSFFMGAVRGALSGRGQYRATGASLVAENAVRVVAAAVVMWQDGGALAFGAALIIGPVAGLVWAPSLRFGSAPPGSAVVRNPLALVSGIAGGSLVAQVVLTGAPVVLAVAGGAPAEVTALFLALAVWRAPYLVAMGVTPQLTTALTRLAATGPRRIARALRGTLLLIIALSVLAAAAGATILEPVLQFVFGSDVSLGRLNLALLGVGTVVALGNLVLLLTLLALGRSRVGTSAWLVALAVTGVWMVLSPFSEVSTIVGAFLLAEVTALVVLTVTVQRSVSARS